MIDPQMWNFWVHRCKRSYGVDPFTKLTPGAVSPFFCLPALLVHVHVGTCTPPGLSQALILAE